MRTRIDIPKALAARHEAAAIKMRQERQARAERQADPKAFFSLFDDHTITENENGAEVTLYGEIGGFWGIDAWALARDLKNLSAEQLTVRVDSGGGSIFDAVLIYNAIVDHAADVHVIVDSVAASAASFIVQAADRRTMNRAAEMMIHEPHVVTWGTAEELREDAEMLDRQAEKIANIYAARSGVAADVWIQEMAGGDTWYSGEKAIEAGLADDVIEFKKPPENDDPAAQASTGRKAHAANKATEPTSKDAPDAKDPAATAADELARQRAEQVVAEAQAAAARSRALANA